MIEVREALRRLLDEIVVPESRAIPARDALGLTLAEPVVADRDFPPTDRSAMDGFAVRAADVARAGSSLLVKGEVRAGADAGSVALRPGEAARIFTGAVLPQGADAVVMVEVCVEDREAGTVVVNEIPG